MYDTSDENLLRLAVGLLGSPAAVERMGDPRGIHNAMMADGAVSHSSSGCTFGFSGSDRFLGRASCPFPEATRVVIEAGTCRLRPVTDDDSGPVFSTLTRAERSGDIVELTNGGVASLVNANVDFWYLLKEAIER